MSISNGPGDFDFLIGCWNSVQRRRAKPLADCDEWPESSATTRCWQLLGGGANVDEVHFPDWGVTGFSVRLHNPATGEWSIYWASSSDGQLTLPPIAGRFSDRAGLLYSEEEYGGRDITVRHKWSEITSTTFRWEQAFSLDAGQTWETNWTADFTRSD